MTSIDPSQRLAAALQAQVAALRERAGVRKASGAPGAHAPTRAALTPAMARRIQAIGPTEPDRQRKAVRIYLEAELAREFGSELLNDASLPGLLDAVQAQMDRDTQLAGAVQALGDLLLARSAG